MPIYEYLCSECTHTLDALQKLSEDPLIYCPQCGAAALKRQMSAPSFRLKGGGWYETDFKNDKRRNISESDSAAAEKAEKKPDGKADQPEQAAKAEKAEKTEKPAKPDATTAKKPEAGAITAKKPDSGKSGDAA
jgi:putative FmdB family regulatory protein